MQCFTRILLAFVLMAGQAPALADYPYAVRAVEVQFEGDATALPASERQKLHEFVRSLRGDVRPGIKCPELIGHAWAEGGGSRGRAAARQRSLSTQRLAYVRSLFARMGATDRDIHFDFAPPKLLQPVGPNRIVIETMLGLRWDARGRCAEWLLG